jgi:hypothetical protein
VLDLLVGAKHLFVAAPELRVAWAAVIPGLSIKAAYNRALKSVFILTFACHGCGAGPPAIGTLPFDGYRKCAALVLSRFVPCAGLVALRQTFVH